MRLLRMAVAGSVLGTAGYWLYRFLKPEHSPLVLNRSVVVITGASAGIGRAFAIAFARRGARVVLAARREELLKQVEEEIAPYAADVLVMPTDITDEAQRQALIDKTLERFGRIDVLINNAGILTRGPLHRTAPDAIWQQVEVDLASAMALTRLCLPNMLINHSGTIVNVAAVLGRVPSPLEPVYAASKAGLIAFSDALRRQISGTGIKVVSVLPSFVQTDMLSPRFEQVARDLGLPVEAPHYVAEHSIDGLLGGQDEIIFGGWRVWAMLTLERIAPRLADLVWRYIVTPDLIAGSDY